MLGVVNHIVTTETREGYSYSLEQLNGFIGRGLAGASCPPPVTQTARQSSGKWKSGELYLETVNTNVTGNE